MQSGDRWAATMAGIRGWNVQCHETTSYICRPPREVEPEVQRCQQLSEKEGATSLTDVEMPSMVGMCGVVSIASTTSCGWVMRLSQTLPERHQHWVDPMRAGQALHVSRQRPRRQLRADEYNRTEQSELTITFLCTAYYPTKHIPAIPEAL